MESTQQLLPCKKCGGPREDTGPSSCPPDLCFPCSQASTTPVESTASEVAETVCADKVPPATQRPQTDMRRKVTSEAEWEEEEARLIEQEWAEKEHTYMSSVLASQAQSADNVVADSQILVSTAWRAPAGDLPALNRSFPSPVIGSPCPHEQAQAQVPESPVYAPASPSFNPGPSTHESQSQVPASPSFAPASPAFGPLPPMHISRGRPSPYVPPVSHVSNSPAPASSTTHESQAPEASVPEPTAPEQSKPETAPKPPGKVRMTPACANCKRSKIRCVHRRVLDNNGNPAAAAPAPAPKKRKRDDPSPGATQGGHDARPAKRALRIRGPKKPEDEEQLAAPVQAQPAPKEEGKRPRGRPRKRKAVTFDEGVEDDEGHSAPPAKRGRKDESAVPEHEPAQLGFPATLMDNIEGASVLAMHSVLSRELDEKLAACQTSLQSTIDSIQDAKRILDAWVEAWTRKKE